MAEDLLRTDGIMLGADGDGHAASLSVGIRVLTGRVQPRTGEGFEPVEAQSLLKDRPQEEDLQLRTREAELSGRLRAEQAKLDELNESLNALVRMLDGTLPK